MGRMITTPFAEFLVFELSLYSFCIFVRPVVVALTGGALESYEVILRHLSVC
jgi:hypothetical protein